LQVGALFPTLTEDKCRKFLQKLDRDGDGKVDLGEWLTFFGPFLSKLPADHVAPGIARLLTNANAK
jgi:Ca2+-binding EF-hand superfamily protein